MACFLASRVEVEGVTTSKRFQFYIVVVLVLNEIAKIAIRLSSENVTDIRKPKALSIRRSGQVHGKKGKNVMERSTGMQSCKIIVQSSRSEVQEVPSNTR